MRALFTFFLINLCISRMLCLSCVPIRYYCRIARYLLHYYLRVVRKVESFSRRFSIKSNEDTRNVFWILLYYNRKYR